MSWKETRGSKPELREADPPCCEMDKRFKPHQKRCVVIACTWLSMISRVAAMICRESGHHVNPKAVGSYEADHIDLEGKP